MSTWSIKLRNFFLLLLVNYVTLIPNVTVNSNDKKIPDIKTQNGWKGYRTERDRAVESFEHVDWNYLYGSNGSAFKV